MFTFKKGKKATGLAGVSYPFADTQIKHKKKQVGYICSPKWNAKNVWGLRFAINLPDGNFKWIRLKATFDTETEARAYVKKHTKSILALNLYSFDD